MIEWMKGDKNIEAYMVAPCNCKVYIYLHTHTHYMFSGDGFVDAMVAYIGALIRAWLKLDRRWRRKKKREGKRQTSSRKI